MKTCTKCGEEKALDEYHRKTTTRDGRKTQCRACVNAHLAEYRTRAEVKAQRAEYMAEYQSRPEVREHRAEYHASPEVRAQQAVYKRTNPHIRWEAGYRERARAYGFDPRVVSFTREALVERYGDRCYHCGAPWSELDHYPVPVAHGGPHTIENTKPSCVTCNRKGCGSRTTNTLKETTA